MMNLWSYILGVVMLTGSGVEFNTGAQVDNSTPLSEARGMNGNVCSMENSTFMPGEQVTYVIYYNWNFVWLPAGEVIFTVTDRGDSYHYKAQGETYDSYEWFYRAEDRYESFVSKQDLRPLKSIREVNEGSYQKYSEAIFDHDKGKVLYRSGKVKGDLEEVREMNVADCMHDLLSALYIARNFDYSNVREGEEVPVNLFLDDDSYDIKYTFNGREEKKIKKLGKFKTLKFTPQLIDGRVFKEDQQMKIWATDDENKLPILIESPVSVGSIKAVLKSADKLKHPLTSKVD